MSEPPETTHRFTNIYLFILSRGSAGDPKTLSRLCWGNRARSCPGSSLFSNRGRVLPTCPQVPAVEGFKAACEVADSPPPAAWPLFVHSLKLRDSSGVYGFIFISKLCWGLGSAGQGAPCPTRRKSVSRGDKAGPQQRAPGGKVGIKGGGVKDEGSEEGI